MPTADSITALTCLLSWNLGVSNSWNHQGLFRDCFTFTLPLTLKEQLVPYSPSAPVPVVNNIMYSWLHRASNNVETFLLPTDAHNVKKHRVIKTF